MKTTEIIKMAQEISSRVVKEWADERMKFINGEKPNIYAGENNKPINDLDTR